MGLFGKFPEVYMGGAKPRFLRALGSFRGLALLEIHHCREIVKGRTKEIAAPKAMSLW
jgi:hypothetical protein